MWRQGPHGNNFWLKYLHSLIEAIEVFKVKTFFYLIVYLQTNLCGTIPGLICRRSTNELYLNLKFKFPTSIGYLMKPLSPTK